MNTVITNCSNNYGPKQHDEKVPLSNELLGSGTLVSHSDVNEAQGGAKTSHPKSWEADENFDSWDS
jgi:hypothetical protein